AHCCWYTQIYRYDGATQHYRPLVHVWGNVNYVLADLDHDGRLELVTRDDRFSYAFSSFADSRWPVRILAYRAGKLIVVTKSYASEIKRDSASLWHEAMARPDEGEQPGHDGRLGRRPVHAPALHGRAPVDREPLEDRPRARRPDAGGVRTSAARLSEADAVLLGQDRQGLHDPDALLALGRDDRLGQRRDRARRLGLRVALDDRHALVACFPQPRVEGHGAE